MEQALDIIQQVIEEHKVIGKGLESLDRAANDVLALMGLEKAKGTLVPGRLDQKESLQNVDALLDSLEKGLRSHFELEETRLLDAFRQNGGPDIVSSLNTILMEHKVLLERLDHVRTQVQSLKEGGMSRHVWEAAANDMRAHIAHTWRLIEAHAEVEHELLTDIKKKLQGV